MTKKRYCKRIFSLIWTSLF